VHYRGVWKPQPICLLSLYYGKRRKKPSDKKRGKYEEPLKTNGSFMDLINIVVKDAKSKDKKKP
jgi:hypothetical protein